MQVRFVPGVCWRMLQPFNRSARTRPPSALLSNRRMWLCTLWFLEIFIFSFGRVPNNFLKKGDNY